MASFNPYEMGRPTPPDQLDASDVTQPVTETPPDPEQMVKLQRAASLLLGRAPADNKGLLGNIIYPQPDPDKNPQPRVSDMIAAALKGPTAAPAAPSAPLAPPKKKKKAAALAAPAAPIAAPLPQGGVGGAATGAMPDRPNNGNPFNTESGESSTKADTSAREAQVISDPNYNTLTARLNREEIEALKNQNTGINDQLGTLKDIATQKSQMDLSPLMSLTDSLTGSKLEKSYRKPASTQDYLNDILAKRNTILGSQQAFSKDQIDLLKSQISGYTQQQLLNTLMGKVESTNQPKQRPFVDPRGNQFITQIRQDIGKQLESDQQAAGIIAAVNSGNPAEQKNIPLAISKYYAGTRPSNQEIALEGGDPSLWAVLDAKLTRLRDGVITPQNQGEYLGFMNDARNLHSQFVQAHANRMRKLGKSVYGLNDGQVNDALPSQFLNPYPTKKSPSVSDMITNALKGSK